MNQQNPAPISAPANRFRLAVIALAVIAAGFAAFAAYRHEMGAERTDDAYVDGNAVLVTAQVGGTVTGFNADTTDHVQAGATLVTLNPADVDIAFDRAKAALAKATRQVRMQFSQVDQGRSEIDVRQNDVRKAEADLSRRSQLAESGAVSREEVSHAAEALDNAKANLATAQQALAQRVAMVDGTSLQTHPDVVAAANHLRDAYLAKVRTQVMAPVSGTVTRRSVQLGERITPGAALMTIVPLDAVWVNANFKESQLDGVRIGQVVRLTSDLYGSAVSYRGTVSGIDAGTGSAFSVLPAQNATGNWIKVTQRVPVRIALDPAEIARHPLRVGLSMHAAIETHDNAGTSTPPVTGAPKAYNTAVFDHELHDADAMVEAVIRANAAQAPAAQGHPARRRTL